MLPLSIFRWVIYCRETNRPQILEEETVTLKNPHKDTNLQKCFKQFTDSRYLMIIIFVRTILRILSWKQFSLCFRNFAHLLSAEICLCKCQVNGIGQQLLISNKRQIFKDFSLFFNYFFSTDFNPGIRFCYWY